MKLYRTKKLLAFLLLIVLTVPLILSMSSDFGGIAPHAQSSKADLLLQTYENTASIFNQISQKPAVKMPVPKPQSFIKDSFSCLVISEQFSTDTEHVVNHRKKIEKILYNHFNGTKYKESTFVI